MRTREILILAGLLVGLGALGFALTGGDEPGLEPGPAEPSDLSLPSPREPAPEPVTAPGSDMPEPLVTAPARTEQDAPSAASGPGPGYGVLDGRVVLSSSTGRGVGQFTILVEEMTNPNVERPAGAPDPVRLTRGFRSEDNESPLYFTFDHVPYSRYSYRVSVFVPGLNGSSQVVQVTEANWAPQVTLSLSGGAPFSLRLTDQLHNPYTARDILIRPYGDPPGRPALQTETDSFGTAIYKSALAGDYEVLMDGQPVGTVSIDPPGFVNDEVGLGVQSARLIIPQGVTLRVEVADQAGFGLADVDVILYAVDTTENRRFEKRSEASGIVDFEHITAGEYQIDLRAPGRQPTSRRVRVKDDAAPESVRVTMALQ